MSPCSLDRSDHLRLNRCPDVEVQGHPRGSPRRKRERADVGFLLGGQALATLIAFAVPVLYNCVLTSLPPSLLESFEQGPFGNLCKRLRGITYIRLWGKQRWHTFLEAILHFLKTAALDGINKRNSSKSSRICFCSWRVKRRQYAALLYVRTSMLGPFDRRKNVDCELRLFIP